MRIPVQPQKEHIQKLYKDRASCDPNSTTLAQTLAKDIHTAFKGGHKFVLELLQNADDAATGAAIAVELRHIPAQQGAPAYLIFSHNGRPFSPEDVEKVADNAQQRYRDKADDLSKTGYKGIGFKSVFSTSSSVQIVSGGYNFRFDEHYPQWKAAAPGALFPWPIIPIWTEDAETPAALRPYIKKDAVTFIMALKPDCDLEADLRFIENHPHLLLFLRNVKSIEIQRSKQVTKMAISDLESGNTALRVNGVLVSEWIINKFEVPIPRPVKEALLRMNEYECPRRLQQAETVGLHFAAQVRENKLTPVKDTQLFCYLPTQLRCGLPYLVNAGFLLNAERTQLTENAWNDFLIYQMAYLQFQWLAGLARIPAFRLQILNLLSEGASPGLPERFKREFVRGFEDGAKSTAFIPRHGSQEELLKLDGLVIDELDFFQRVKIKSDLRIADHALESLDRLRQRKEVSVFGVDGLCGSLASFARANPTLEFQTELLAFLFDCLTKRLDVNWGGKLGAVRFLLTQEGTLLAPDGLYLPLTSDADLVAIFKLSFMHATLALEKYHKMLKQLGVRDPSLIEILRGHVFQLIEQGKINVDNNIDIVRLIFRAFQQGMLNQEDYRQLLKLPLLTKGGKLIACQAAYLPDAYKPRLPLETTLGAADIFVSELYETNPALANEWKRFFISLGVSESIRFYARNLSVGAVTKKHEAIGRAYLSEIQRRDWTAKELKSEHTIDGFLDSNAFRYLQLPGFFAVFIRAIIADWANIEKLDESSQYRMPSRRLPSIGLSFLRYYLQNIKCFPRVGGGLECGKSLYAPSFRDFSKALAVADLDTPMTEKQMDFFGFKRSLSVDDCLLLLNQLNKSPAASIAQYLFILKLIVKLLPELPEAEKLKFKKWQGLLPAQNNKLMPKRQLKCFAIADKQAPADSDLWLKELSGITPAELASLAVLLDIPVVGADKLKLSTIGARKAAKIHEDLCIYLPVIARVEAHASGSNEKELLQGFSERLAELDFIEVDRMSLEQKTEDGKAGIPVRAHLEEGKFYVNAVWNNKRNLPQFCSQLGAYLNLSSKTMTVLSHIFQEDSETLNEWLSENGYAADRLPVAAVAAKKEIAELTERMAAASLEDETGPKGAPPESAREPIARAPSSGFWKADCSADRPAVIKAEPKKSGAAKVGAAPAQNAEANVQAVIKRQASSVSTSSKSFIVAPQKSGLDDETKKAIGEWGERFVYTSLRAKYQEKYPQCQFVETPEGFKLTGLDKSGKPLALEVVWCNKNGESGRPLDLIVTRNGKSKVIEVKTTSSSSESVLFISENEWALMREVDQRYRLFRVYDAGKPNARIEKVRDVYQKVLRGELPVSQLQLRM